MVIIPSFGCWLVLWSFWVTFLWFCRLIWTTERCQCNCNYCAILVIIDEYRDCLLHSFLGISWFAAWTWLNEMSRRCPLMRCPGDGRGTRRVAWGRELWGRCPSVTLRAVLWPFRFGQRGCGDDDSAPPEFPAAVPYSDNPCRAEHTTPGCKSTQLIWGSFVTLCCWQFTVFGSLNFMLCSVVQLQLYVWVL